MPEQSIERRVADLVAIAKEVKTCTKCRLHEGRHNAVPGAGPANAEIMFIGEGPGANEDEQGLPFVGQSGRLLTDMLSSIGLTRRDVFIGNVVKCRPPENRDPLPDEIEICTSNYLYRQIGLVNPKIIVTLGRFSMALFFPNAKISAIHGQAKFQDGRYILPMFHPAAVLRNPGLRDEAFADFARLPALLEEWDNRQATLAKTGDSPSAPGAVQSQESEKSEDAGGENAPQQLSLF
jgi:DNA polymerase